MDLEFRPYSKTDQLGVKQTKDSKGHRRTMVHGNCTRCGKYFEKRKDKTTYKDICQTCARRKANDERIGKQGKRRGENKKCLECQKEFYVPPNRVVAKFCSHKCYSDANKDKVPSGFINSVDNSGKKNGRYKDGKRVGEKATQNTPKNRVRAEVIKRDGNWCLICGKPPKGLHLHRVVYGAQGGKYEKGNCVQLCGSHHSLVHTSKKRFQPILNDYLEMVINRKNDSEPTEPPLYWKEWMGRVSTIFYENGNRL